MSPGEAAAELARSVHGPTPVGLKQPQPCPLCRGETVRENGLVLCVGRCRARWLEDSGRVERGMVYFLTSTGYLTGGVNTHINDPALACLRADLINPFAGYGEPEPWLRASLSRRLAGTTRMKGPALSPRSSAHS